MYEKLRLITILRGKGLNPHVTVIWDADLEKHHVTCTPMSMKEAKELVEEIMAFGVSEYLKDPKTTLDTRGRCYRGTLGCPSQTIHNHTDCLREF